MLGAIGDDKRNPGMVPTMEFSRAGCVQVTVIEQEEEDISKGVPSFRRLVRPQGTEMTGREGKPWGGRGNLIGRAS